jgi:NADH-quinone oxidoreductase subunit K
MGNSIYLLLSAFVFSAGVALVLTRQNVIAVLIGVELVFNAANINFVYFNALYPERLDGQFFALVVITIAAAETALALAIIVKLYRTYHSTNLDEISNLVED